MRKVLALLLMILLALGSVAGYLFLHGKIIAGERQIAEGYRQVKEETANLEKGKVKLEAGKQKAAEGKKRYKDNRGNLFKVLADKLFKGGRGFKKARDKIADGDKRIAEGEDKVSDGEKRLEAGLLKLRQGKELVRRAKRVRVACAFGAAFFASLSIVLGFRWRRSLARTLLHADT